MNGEHVTSKETVLKLFAAAWGIPVKYLEAKEDENGAIDIWYNSPYPIKSVFQRFAITMEDLDNG